MLITLLKANCQLIIISRSVKYLPNDIRFSKIYLPIPIDTPITIKIFYFIKKILFIR